MSKFTKGPWAHKLKDGCDMNRPAWVVEGSRPTKRGDRHHQSRQAAKTDSGSQWVAMAFAPLDPIGRRGGLSCTSNGFTEGEANAHLIAAAPELYEVCKALVDLVSDLDPHTMHDELGTARAALAKANGEGVG